MTRIDLFRHDGVYCGMRCSGHSGFSEAGSDIVCAAVSTLVINCINSVETFTEDAFAVESDEAAAWISFRFTGEVSGAGRLLLDSTVLGLENVAADYEDCILIEVQEV